MLTPEATRMLYQSRSLSQFFAEMVRNGHHYFIAASVWEKLHEDDKQDNTEDR